MSFTVTRIHKDWYRDEILFDGRKDGYGEDLYRLDFSVGENSFQAQVFLTTAMKEKKFDRLFAGRWPKPGELEYRSARLFLERDNRIAFEDGGDSDRWDYACHGWHMKPFYAEELLRKGEKSAVKLMSNRVKFVVALPNDRKFITSCHGPAARTPDDFEKGRWDRIQKKWAEVDRLKAEQEKAG